MRATTSQPKRIQRKRTKGSNLPPKTLCVTRPSLFSNPYTLEEFGGLALPLFRNTLCGIWNPSLLDGKPDAYRWRAYDLHHAWLRRFKQGHPLDVLRTTLPQYDFIACWCPLDHPCHVDSILELANQ